MLGSRGKSEQSQNESPMGSYKCITLSDSIRFRRAPDSTRRAPDSPFAHPLRPLRAARRPVAPPHRPRASRPVRGALVPTGDRCYDDVRDNDDPAHHYLHFVLILFMFRFCSFIYAHSIVFQRVDCLYILSHRSIHSKAKNCVSLTKIRIYFWRFQT